jgi:hypothetical protein
VIKRVAIFTGVTLAIIAVGAWGATLFVSTPGVATAVWTSAAVATVVQIASFALTRATQPGNVVAGWGSGMLLRFLALALYGFFGVRALGLMMGPALLSLAAFLFLTTLVEPAFLK